jgi:hypothetical protein
VVWASLSSSIYRITFDINNTNANSNLWVPLSNPVYSLTRNYDDNALYGIVTNQNLFCVVSPTDGSYAFKYFSNYFTAYTSLEPVLYYNNKRLFFAYKNTVMDTNIRITYFDVSGTTFTLSTNKIICTEADSLTSMTVDNNNNVYVVGFRFGINIIYKSTTALCFNKGTKIFCMNNNQEDEYVNIELLQIGDFVKTYKHGYRKVIKVISGILINNPKKLNMCMYKMAKTETNVLIEDLIVTGGHSILVDAITDEEQNKYDEMGLTEFSKTTIDNKRLLLSSVSDQFSPMQDTEVYTYYHLLLENNDDKEERFGIWANGILTETPNEKILK